MPTPLPPSTMTFDAKPVMVRLSDGTLLALFFRSHQRADTATARFSGHRVTMRTSTDHGRTWSTDTIVLTLPTDQGGFFRQDGLEALVDDQDEVHLFFLNDANTGVVPTLEKFVAVPGEDQRPKAGAMKTARLDIWHMRTAGGRTDWPQPRPIWIGYSGSLNSVAQLRSGRIVLPFSYLTDRTWGGNRGSGADAFTFRGQYNSTVVYSDDHGTTWQTSPAALSVVVPDIVSAYGAVEPVVHELRDGRVWMLIRTQCGRFYESFSTDGVHWSAPQPTRITASDSPPALVGLSDGRMVMFWNNALRFPYAYGGRHVMHAAISDDDGQTWRGYREVARDPKRHDPPPPSGDHGTGYPFAVATAQDNVILSTGQDLDKAECVVIDPQWLCQTNHVADFSPEAQQWASFGTRGVELVPHPDRRSDGALRLSRPDAHWPAAAVWNFPSLARGTLQLRLRIEAGAAPLRISLADHFSVPFDDADALYALCNLTLCAADKSLGAAPLTPDAWHTIRLTWDWLDRRQCDVLVDKQPLITLPLLHETVGACYLRLVVTEPCMASVWVEHAETMP